MGAVAYEDDFYSWSLNQAELLKTRHFEQLDLEHLIEELQSMSAREKRELLNRLRILIMHLLKWEFQPNYPIKTSWQTTIRNQRHEIESLLEDSPSLKNDLEAIMAKAYPKAVMDAADESGLSKKLFPKECTWNIDEILDHSFWPSAS